VAYVKAVVLLTRTAKMNWFARRQWIGARSTLHATAKRNTQAFLDAPMEAIASGQYGQEVSALNKVKKRLC
jgi:hypothetical protein